MRFEGADGAIREVVIDPEVPLSELRTALGGRGELLVEGVRADLTRPVGSIWDGSRLGTEPTFAPAAVVELVGVSGIDAGARWRLAPGGYELTDRGGPTAFVDRTGSISITPGARRIRPGEVIEAGGTLWLVRLPATPQPRPAPVQGRRSFNRPPRSLPANLQELVPCPVAPEATAPRARLGWAMLAGPILVGSIMAFVFRPMMALIALVGPLMMGLSWVEDRVRLRRIGKANEASWAEALTLFECALEEAVAREVAGRSRRHPDLADVVAAPWEMQAGLWERRPHHPDFLRISIGRGRVSWEPPVGDRVGDPDLDVAAILERHARLAVGPVEVDLSTGTMLGVVGSRPSALALVRALLLRLTVHHGPADVRVAVITNSPAHWEWCGWLPHARVDSLSGRYRLAADPGDVESVVASVSRPGDEALVVFVDACDLSPPLRTRLAALVEAGNISAVFIERSAENLPGSCRAVVSVTGSTARLTHLSDRGDPTMLSLDGVQLDVAALTARHLHGIDDPEETSAGIRLSAAVTLSSLIGFPTDEGDQIARWRDPPAGLKATVGMTENGPLVVDLVADGPHGLVAGTTGSGKSEFLRSMIGALAADYGPDRVTFALIDYKGGSAFDSCAGLPHVVGLVTDLDHQLGRRALRSLEAELRRREEILREVGADAIETYGSADDREPLPRLLVIIDEFAALAADLPDFVSSLVDVSQRGRSLGVHLILATQRPAGVVGDSIRANTNLRVSLRVQTSADSRDVIDDPIAARLPRRFPGRGFVRLGPGELIPFQAAQSSATGDTESATPEVRAVRFGWEPVVERVPSEPIVGPSDLDRLTRTATAAFANLGLAAPRRLWAPPLPEVIELGEGPEQVGRVIGLADEPDLQDVAELVWDPARGGLLAFGVDGSGASDAIVAAAYASAALIDPDRLHIYGLDGAGGALDDIRAWPHTGAVVRSSDRERVIRLVRRLQDALEQRRRGSADRAQILVVADRLEAVLGAFDGPGDTAIREMLSRVIVDGPTYGIFPLVSVTRPGAVPSSVAASFEQRLCFRLADPLEYAAVGLTPREVPKLCRGRGLDASARLIHIGRPSARALQAVVDATQQGNLPLPIGALPDRVPLDAVLPHSRLVDDGRFVPIGIGDHDLAPVGFRLYAGDHALIAGPARSGRTTALASIAQLAAAGDPNLEIITLARSKSALTEAAGTCYSSVDEFVEALSAGFDRKLVLIDDAERVEHPELAAWLESQRTGVHVIAAGRADALRGLYQHWTRGIRRCRLGLSLSPQPDVDGELWQTQFPRRGPILRQPGRGYLVSGGEIEVVQVAAS